MYNIIAIIIYVFFLVCYYFFQKSQTPFQTKTNWWTNGFSVFAVSVSIVTPLIISGIYHNEGIGGLWFFWCAYLISGFLPFVFAPLWAKLNFITDNQFILFRFSGKSAKILHQFRAIYVGLFIVAFLISFQTLALLKVITFYTGWNRNTCFLILSILLFLICFKNQIRNNLKLDKFHVLLMLSVFLIALFSLYKNSLGHNESINYLAKNSPSLLEIFPENKTYLFVLFFIQTWSVNLFDGSGIDAQRYFSQKNKRNVWKVAVLNTALHFIFMLILILILIYGSAKFPTLNTNDKETYILHYLNTNSWLNPLILIALIATFTTSYTGLLNWGSSFLSVDIYKTYVNKSVSEKKLKNIAILYSILILISSLIFTYFNTNLEVLIKLLFSITAGVAPVFVLRWFWLRINAYSQISAMIGSGVFTILYLNYVELSSFKLYYASIFNLNDYSFQLIFVTFLTSILWVIVTLITQKDDKQVLEKFSETVFRNFYFKKSFFKAIVFGLSVVLLLILALSLLVSND